MGGRGRRHSRDLRLRTIQSIDKAVQAGARLKPACKLAGISARTLHRWKADNVGEDRRKGPRQPPKNKLSPEEQKRVLETLNAPEYRDLSPKQLVPRLADQGRYDASEATMYRLLRKNKQMVHRARSRSPRHYKPKALEASAPMQVLCWDITYLPTCIKGQFYYWYVFEDLYSRAVVGQQVFEREDQQLSSWLLEETLVEHEVSAGRVVVHSDNGGPMKGATMLATMERLGVVASFSRPGISNDNPHAEALFRTAKYRPEYPYTPFEDIASAQAWCDRFVRWYNTEHRHSSLNFVTPQERFEGQDRLLLAKRSSLYALARERHPERWSGGTRNWAPVGSVQLNPEKGKSS